MYYPRHMVTRPFILSLFEVLSKAYLFQLRKVHCQHIPSFSPFLPSSLPPSLLSYPLSIILSHLTPGTCYLLISLAIYIYIFVFLPFLGLLPQHKEVPRLGVKSELQLPAYTTATATQDLSHICDVHHSSWQCRILNPLSEDRDRTHNFMVPSQIHFHCATMGIPLKKTHVSPQTLNQTTGQQSSLDVVSQLSRSTRYSRAYLRDICECFFSPME